MTRTLTLALVLGALAGGSLLAGTQTTSAAIHEMVAAYCSGGGVGSITEDGHLEPRGITGGSNADNFAQPVLSNGVVDFPLVTDHPAAKYPAGSNIFALPAPDHPSAAHCRALRP